MAGLNVSYTFMPVNITLGSTNKMILLATSLEWIFNHSTLWRWKNLFFFQVDRLVVVLPSEKCFREVNLCPDWTLLWQERCSADCLSPTVYFLGKYIQFWFTKGIGKVSKTSSCLPLCGEQLDTSRDAN